MNTGTEYFGQADLSGVSHRPGKKDRSNPTPSCIPDRNVAAAKDQIYTSGHIT